ncbi:MAG: CRISPR-associated helicase Cas3', partial [Candidatus Hadarchaeum sp.]
MNTNTLLALWGKTVQGSDVLYHPLFFHMCDVAFCARALWERLPRHIQQKLSSAVGMSVEEAKALFSLLAGLHDLGKAYPKFQEKAPQFRANLEQHGFDFPSDTNSPPHNFVSSREVIRLFAESPGFSLHAEKTVACTLAYILGAHHGVFPTSDDIQQNITRRTLGNDSPLWEQSRDQLAHLLVKAIPGAETLDLSRIKAINDCTFAPLLAAFISIADWFGSSKYFLGQLLEERFNRPLTSLITETRLLQVYPPYARQQAQIALDHIGWQPPPEPPRPADFAFLFRYLDPDSSVNPNAMQQKVCELLSSVSSPALWIIEEEMGAGKTEAAFFIFHHAQARGIAHGIYIAMPTQATSNAMHDRLTNFLCKGRGERDLNLVLAHAHATLDPKYRKRIEEAAGVAIQIFDEIKSDGTVEPEHEAVLRVRSWFTANKQTLLAHYGVGTVDQALFGVLQTRHWFVRLFGLAGKVVVFDEVHAYDTYMNTLLQRLIQWLARLDCTVVLLSATLPEKIRLALADAYRSGAKQELVSQKPKTAYPRITLISSDDGARVRAYSIEQRLREKRRKTIAIEHHPNNASTIADVIRQTIPGDGCTIVICNTVSRAQAMYSELKAQVEPDGWKCLLFHARMPFCWRKAREEEVLRRFGKDSGGRGTFPREKTLLIATQVVEQSLDIDADFIVSELAPVDLILQRAGRLWRHSRQPTGRTIPMPCLALLYDLQPNGLPSVAVWKDIYAEYILLRSYLALLVKDASDGPWNKGLRTHLIVPDDMEPLIEEVYGAPDPACLPDEWC